jgi:hypothetical protein
VADVGAMASEPRRARGVLRAELRGCVGLDGGERRGWRSGPTSHVGLGEGVGAGEPRQGQVATAMTRQWLGVWGGDEASGNSGGLERKRESERRKKGRRST